MAQDGLSLLHFVLLAGMTGATSILTAIIGFGGGMLLLALMPLFVPLAAIVPIHGATQISSNFSRAFFSRQDIVWRLLPPYIAGALAGMVAMLLTFLSLPLEYLPLFIGIYMLLNTWHPGFMAMVNRFESMFFAGFLLTALSLLVGAPGPVFWPMMMKKLPQRNQLVATTAVMVALSHSLKIIGFGAIGFAYSDHISMMVAMIAGAIGGSWVGTRLRRKARGTALVTITKVALSILALNMIYQVFTL